MAGVVVGDLTPFCELRHTFRRFYADPEPAGLYLDRASPGHGYSSKSAPVSHPWLRAACVAATCPEASTDPAWGKDE